VEAYTFSIDAALTLMPEGCIFLLTNTSVDKPEADTNRATAHVGPPLDTGIEPVEAARPALALCAAALRTRAALLKATGGQ
jgi:hypothetical protein